MLSLNPVPDNKAQAREVSLPRPRSANTEEREQRADFQSLLLATVQPAKAEQQPVRAKDTTESYQQPALKNESGTPAVTAPGVNEIKGDAVTAPNDAHDAAKTGHNEAASTEKKAGADKAPAETAAPRRSPHDMLQALGLTALAARTTTANAALRATDPTAGNKMAGKLTEAARAHTARTQTATTTLSLLQNAPDAILAQNDGLKRLSEKIGIGFLSKFAEKLNEKSPRGENSTTQRPEAARDALSQTSLPHANKAGHNQSRSESDADAKNNQRGSRTQTSRTVSRETSAQESGATLRQAQGDNFIMVSPANHDTITTRQQAPALPAGLADAAATARSSDNIRAAVENPLMRPDLVRQFNEVMTRAQVLITDNDNARFSVKLFPRELGRMEIDLKLVDGEMRGKIVVESEDVKNEMQNFLQNGENNQNGETVDLGQVTIEVRSESQNAQNSDRTPDDAELLQNLVTRTASVLYEAVDVPQQKGNALYA